MLKAISTRSQLKVNRTRPRQFLYSKMNPFGYQYLLAKRRGIILRAMISHHQKKRRPRNVYQRALTSSRATDGEFNRIIPILREKDDVKHFQYFRMGKDQFDAIHDRIQQVIERGPNHATNLHYPFHFTMHYLLHVYLLSTIRLQQPPMRQLFCHDEENPHKNCSRARDIFAPQ